MAQQGRDVPADNIGKLEPNYYCRGWNAKRGKYCRSRAGVKTDHPGEGRCRFHDAGADKKIIHGQRRRYRITTPRIAELLEQFETDENPLDLLPEVALLRALVIDYIERYEANTAALAAWHDSFKSATATVKPTVILDIADASRILDRVGAMVKRIEDVKGASAFTMRQMELFFAQLDRIHKARITDPVVLDRVTADVLAIQVG